MEREGPREEGEGGEGSFLPRPQTLWTRHWGCELFMCSADDLLGFMVRPRFS